MAISADYVNFKVAYQVSPIILGPGGIADAMGGAVPIIFFTDPTTISLFGASLQTGAYETDVSDPNINLDAFFASYVPLPGATLINNQVAMYPFANQAVAANALIAQPLNVSMLMQCPAGNSQSYSEKSATMAALQQTLFKHNNLGGLYSIVTPSYVYTNCIMTGMADVTQGNSRQVQYLWRLDFIQPLVTLAQAQTAQNGLMQTLTNGTPTSGNPSWSSGAGLQAGNPSQTIGSVSPPSAGLA